MNAATTRPDIRSSARIATFESLREHLQWAIELEHFTLPPYLCALYLLDAIRNPEASEAVVSVLVEEMLHIRWWTGDTISIDWNGVRPMRHNPRTSDHAPGSAIRRAQEQFNEWYCALLRLLDTAFNGSPQTLRTAFGSMYRLKVQAQALMEMPTEDGLTTAGPTFEYVP